jgi:hypothetical protein
MVLPNNSMLPANYFNDEDTDDDNIIDALWCQSSNNITNNGVWYFPNGNLVTSSIGVLYTKLEAGQIGLHRSDSLQNIEGIYKCVIADENNINQTLLVGLYRTVTYNTSTGPVVSPNEFNKILSCDDNQFNITFTVENGTATYINCSVNDEPIKPTTIHQTILSYKLPTNISVLMIFNSSKEGLYNCTVSNSRVEDNRFTIVNPAVFHVNVSKLISSMTTSVDSITSSDIFSFIVTESNLLTTYPYTASLQSEYTISHTYTSTLIFPNISTNSLSSTVIFPTSTPIYPNATMIVISTSTMTTETPKDLFPEIYIIVLIVVVVCFLLIIIIVTIIIILVILCVLRLRSKRNKLVINRKGKHENENSTSPGITNIGLPVGTYEFTTQSAIVKENENFTQQYDMYTYDMVSDVLRNSSSTVAESTIINGEVYSVVNKKQKNPQVQKNEFTDIENIVPDGYIYAAVNKPKGQIPINDFNNIESTFPNSYIYAAINK